MATPTDIAFIRANHDAQHVKIDQLDDWTWTVERTDIETLNWEAPTVTERYDTVHAAIGGYVGGLFAADIEPALVCEEVELLAEWLEEISANN